jgi:hypothetical protein
MQNQDPGGEPPLGLTGDRAPTGSPPVTPNVFPSPPHWHVGPRPRHRPRTVPPLAGQVGRLPTRPRAPALSWAKFPLGLASRGNPFLFSFFHFLFLFSHIFTYIDILCTKNSLNKL